MRFFGRLLDQWQLPLLTGHQAFLLRQFQGRGRTGIKAGLHQVQYIARIRQVELGNLQALAGGQGLRVAVGHVAEQGQLHVGLIELTGLQAVHGAVAGSGAATPEVDFVAGREVGIIVGDGPVALGGVQLRVAAAAQQPLTAGAEVELQFRQQRCTGNYRRGLGLADTRHGRRHVEAVTAGLVDQAVQRRAAKLRPPTLVDGLGRFAFGKMPGGGRSKATVDGGRVSAAGREQQAHTER